MLSNTCVLFCTYPADGVTYWQNQCSSVEFRQMNICVSVSDAVTHQQNGWATSMSNLKPSWNPVPLYSVLHIDSPWLWAVTGKCRPIRLLSGAVPPYAPTGQLILSLHMRMRRHHVWSDICPLDTCPLPQKQLSWTLCPRLCQGRYGRQMSAMVIFGGHVSGRGRCPARATYKRCYEWFYRNNISNPIDKNGYLTNC